MLFVDQRELDGTIGNAGLGGDFILLASPPLNCGFHHLFLLMHKQGK